MDSCSGEKWAAKDSLQEDFGSALEALKFSSPRCFPAADACKWETSAKSLSTLAGNSKGLSWLSHDQKITSPCLGGIVYRVIACGSTKDLPTMRRYAHTQIPLKMCMGCFFFKDPHCPSLGAMIKLANPPSPPHTHTSWMIKGLLGPGSLAAWLQQLSDTVPIATGWCATLTIGGREINGNCEIQLGPK